MSVSCKRLAPTANDGKIKIIENFLNKNLEFDGKSKLIKYLIDHYISLANISEGCKKADFINKEIKDKYLEKFRIYCLVLNKKQEEAILNFDLLRDEGRSDKFFNDKISFLLGLQEKTSDKISDKNLLNFYLSLKFGIQIFCLEEIHLMLHRL